MSVVKVTTVAGAASGSVAGRFWQAPVAIAASVAVTGAVLGAAPLVPAGAGAVSAEVSLAAFADPLGTLVGTVMAIGNDVFNGLDTYDSYPWDPYQGLLPEFIYTALPIVSQLGFNGGNYIGGTIEAFGTVVQLLSGAVWNLPGAVVTAATQAIGGDFAGALNTLANATIVPIQTAGTVALDAGIAVIGGVAFNLTNLAVTIPGIIGSLVSTLQGGLFAIAGSVGAVVTQTFAALTTLNLETAWNTLVNGLLGPVGADGLVTSSIPGTLLAVTLGPGVGPLGPGNGYAVESLRMWGERTQLTVANALGANFPVTAVDVAEVAEASPAPALAGRGAPQPAAATPAATPVVAAPVAPAGDQGGADAVTVTADREAGTAAAAPQSARSDAAAGAGDSDGPSKQRAVRGSGRGAAGGATAGSEN